MKSKTLTALFVTVCLTGCIGTMAAQAEDAQKMKLVTDGAGNEIEVPEEIERYAVSAGPYCMVTWCVDALIRTLSFYGIHRPQKQKN